MLSGDAAVASAVTIALAVITLEAMSRIFSFAPDEWNTQSSCVVDNAVNDDPCALVVPLSMVATVPGVIVLPDISST